MKINLGTIELAPDEVRALGIHGSSGREIREGLLMELQRYIEQELHQYYARRNTRKLGNIAE